MARETILVVFLCSWILSSTTPTSNLGDTDGSPVIAQAVSTVIEVLFLFLIRTSVRARASFSSWISWYSLNKSIFKVLIMGKYISSIFLTDPSRAVYSIEDLVSVINGTLLRLDFISVSNDVWSVCRNEA